MSDLVRIRRALVSVSDKSGLVEFAQALAAQGATAVQLGFTGVLASTTVVPAWGIVMLVLGALYLDLTGTLRFAAAGSLREADERA